MVSRQTACNNREPFAGGNSHVYVLNRTTSDCSCTERLDAVFLSDMTSVPNLGGRTKAQFSRKMSYVRLLFRTLTDTQTHTETDRQRQTDRDRHTQTDTDRQTQTHRDRHRDRHRETQRERDRQTHTDTDTDTDTDTHTDTDTDTDTRMHVSTTYVQIYVYILYIYADPTGFRLESPHRVTPLLRVFHANLVWRPCLFLACLGQPHRYYKCTQYVYLLVVTMLH